ncbi:hypothetical protein PHMEG_00024498 [Phytophthora megakarya]|uniref:Uncharacterized protein n=1 Tax=Phytophthora megakarya TaxID=4795 RepID=A0A225VFT0_9STRA|nr:hypothetical protein PHMEG_00024498 [Phytophthora megakarya]
MELKSLFELNVQQAIASIVQKPRWWIKIQDSDSRELELQFLLKTFEQSLERGKTNMTDEEKHLPVLKQEVESIESYPVVKWTFNQLFVAREAE